MRIREWWKGIERRLGTQKISLSTAQLRVSPVMFTVEASNRTGSTLWEERSVQRDQKTEIQPSCQWWLALALGKKGEFPLPPELSSSLHHLDRGHSQRYAGKYLTTWDGGREASVGSICQFPWCKTPTVVHFELSV